MTEHAGHSFREQGVIRRHAVVWRCTVGVCRALLRLLGITRSVRGPRPRAGTLIVANHLSWIDIPVAIATWRCTIIAKSEVRRWPLIGVLGDALGVIWIDRSRPRDLLRVIPLVEQALRRGSSVLLFAEGTTSDGHGVRPFHSALFEAAVRARATVTPVALSASTAAGDPDALCWYGTETLVANLARVITLSKPRVVLHVGAPIDASRDRKVLARVAREHVVRRFSPVRSQGASERAKQNLRPIDSSEREIFA